RRPEALEEGRVPPDARRPPRAWPGPADPGRPAGPSGRGVPGRPRRFGRRVPRPRLARRGAGLWRARPGPPRRPGRSGHPRRRAKTATAHLTDLSLHGAAWRYPGEIPEKVRGLLRSELALIEELDYPNYFLTVHDIVAWARAKGILCQGRGSAANSVVCFCLG